MTMALPTRPSHEPRRDPAVRGSRIDGARARYQQHGAVASPGRSLVLLYERLLRDLDDATLAVGGGDHAAAHDALIHAQKIVDGLELSLDRSTWNAASALGAVYEYLGNELVAANISKDPRRIAACRQVVAPLAEAWRDAWVELVGGPTSAGSIAETGAGAA
jgi:flagellar protein FliS